MLKLAYALPDLGAFWVPVVGIVFGTILAAVVVGLVLNHKQRIQELEHTLSLRRMEHERRMKELELELARINAGVPAGMRQ